MGAGGTCLACDQMLGEGEKTANPAQAIAQAYARGETDEFIAPTVIGDYTGARGGDGLFCLNFRADRAREIFGRPWSAKFCRV